jgi:energy-coupling factor transporter ATP-binding protein EcfA2
MTTDESMFEDLEEKEEQEHETPLIQRIKVEDLFGQYTYNIQVRNLDAPRIILLYGDNGSGKTTILNMLWHLLSSSTTRGHRTALARIPFREFGVRLSNGDDITVKKTVDLTGDYEISVTNSKSLICKESYPTDDSLKVQLSLKRTALIQEYLSPESNLQGHTLAELENILEKEVLQDRYIDYLKRINISPYFLADDRKIYSDHLTGEAPRRSAANARSPLSEAHAPEEVSGLADELAVALRRTSNWLRSQIISATAQGSVGADAIYLEVLSQLVGTSHIDEEEPSLGQVKKRIEELELRTRRYSEFGLVPSLQAEPLLKLLDKAARSGHARASLIEDVLTPYLDGQRARLDSLQPTETLIRIFVETVNSFLVNKRITYTLRWGLRIRTESHEVLGPGQLSSGERQLLLLLCNSLLSRAESALFIIDEPEISLNVKWQRKLIPALLACVPASNVQFILATHSVEIITGHREFLAQLKAGARSR